MDDRLSELERRWRQTGAVEDEAAYLGDRVRSGELASERLELAAISGSAAARHVLGQNEPTPLRALAERLTAEGELVFARAMVAVARTLLPLWTPPSADAMRTEHLRLAQEHGRDLRVVEPARAIEAVETWILCPCDEHADVAWDLACATRDFSELSPRPAGALSGRAADAAMEWYLRRPGSPIHDAAIELEAPLPSWQSLAASDLVALAADPSADEERLRTAIRDALVPWVLGYGDPLRDRRETQ